MSNKAKASTQQHLDIEDITENLVILKVGSVAMILATTAVNFDILSEAEQDATIYAYAAFLNSLSFPVQVLIRSKKADITSYYQHLEESVRNQPNPDLKRQIQKYMEFLQSTVQQKTILDKQFYFIISFSQLDLGIKAFKRGSQTKYKSKADLARDAQVNLFPRRDHIIKQAARLGLAARQLTTKELIELYYDIYNPAPTGTQRIILDTDSFTAPLVKPAVESPEPASPTLQQGETGANSQNAQPASQVIPNIGQTVEQPSQSQEEALKNLKETASYAASFVTQRQEIHSQTYQPGQQIATDQKKYPF